MGAGIRVGKQELEQETRDRLPFSFKVTGQLCVLILPKIFLLVSMKALLH
jgi:hypothetical protein